MNKPPTKKEGDSNEAEVISFLGFYIKKALQAVGELQATLTYYNFSDYKTTLEYAKSVNNSVPRKLKDIHEMLSSFPRQLSRPVKELFTIVSDSVLGISSFLESEVQSLERFNLPEDKIKMLIEEVLLLNTRIFESLIKSLRITLNSIAQLKDISLKDIRKFLIADFLVLVVGRFRFFYNNELTKLVSQANLIARTEILVVAHTPYTNYLRILHKKIKKLTTVLNTALKYTQELEKQLFTNQTDTPPKVEMSQVKRMTRAFKAFTELQLYVREFYLIRELEKSYIEESKQETDKEEVVRPQEFTRVPSQKEIQERAKEFYTRLALVNDVLTRLGGYLSSDEFKRLQKEAELNKEYIAVSIEQLQNGYSAAQMQVNFLISEVNPLLNADKAVELEKLNELSSFFSKTLADFVGVMKNTAYFIQSELGEDKNIQTIIKLADELNQILSPSLVKSDK